MSATPQPRVLLARLSHESHAFSRLITTLAEFGREELLFGEDILTRLAGTRTEIVVRGLGDKARHDAGVVRHRYQGAGSFDGTSFTDDHRCVMVWEKLAGEWRLVMEQCSFSGK